MRVNSITLKKCNFKRTVNSRRHITIELLPDKKRQTTFKKPYEKLLPVLTSKVRSLRENLKLRACGIERAIAVLTE